MTAEYAKNNFNEIIERASKESGGVVIVQENKSFILISQEELETWFETAELLQEPNLQSDIEEAQKEYQKGEALTMAQIFG